MARLAARQHGVVSGRQLRSLGLSQDVIDRRVAAGKLHRLHGGVFAVGHPAITEEGRILAGVLSVGADAAAGSLSALALWGIRTPVAGEVVHVTTTRKIRSRPNAVCVSVVDELPETDLSRRRGLRVVTASRALREAAIRLGHRELRRAIGQALVLRRTSIAALVEQIARDRGRRGTGRLARALADAKPTRSELEDAAAAMLTAHGLPSFDTNKRVSGWEADVVWFLGRLVVELDSTTFHDNPITRADDAAKQAALEGRGLTVIRLRWADVTTGQAAAVDRIRRALTHETAISRARRG